MVIVLPPPLDSPTSTIVLATAVLGGLLWLYVSRDRPRSSAHDTKHLRPIPFPDDTLPLLGNLLLNFKPPNQQREWVVQQCKAFDFKPWRRRIPGQPDLITITSPEAIEEITTTQFDNFIKGSFQLDIIRTLVGSGVIASDGERWYHMRKAAVTFFSARTLRAFMDKSVAKNLTQLCAVLDRSIETNTQVGLKQLFHDFTLQTFVEMGLGVQLDWIGADQVHPFQEAIEGAARLLVTRFRRPASFWKLQRWLNVGVEGEIAGHMKVVYDWLQGVIEQGLSAAAAKTTSPSTDANDTKSVIQRFAELSDEEKDGLRAEDLADFLLTFVIAARDTTAMSVSWIFYALGKHPGVEAKIRSELRTRFPDLYGRRDVIFGTEHLKELVYLEATIRETLRLFPAVPSAIKQVVRDTVICGDTFLRQGELVILHVFAMGRNPKIWGPDAAEFKPERWIDPETHQIRVVSPTKFFTFHAGPRTCIGMSLAMLELRAVTANLINRYRFELDPSNDGSTSIGPTLIMAQPLLATVSRLDNE